MKITASAPAKLSSVIVMVEYSIRSVFSDVYNRYMQILYHHHYYLHQKYQIDKNTFQFQLINSSGQGDFLVAQSSWRFDFHRMGRDDTGRFHARYTKNKTAPFGRLLYLLLLWSVSVLQQTAASVVPRCC